MSREITNSDIKKKGNKFHAVADWRDGTEGGTERQEFDSFDAATAWIEQLESESDSNSSPANSGNSQNADNTARPPVPVPGEDNSHLNGDNSHSPAAQGHTASTVPTATDKDTIPEPAASDMNPADAENINSNINPAPVPAGAEQGGLRGDPFSNPLSETTAADTQPAPSDHNVSNEVQNVQNPGAEPSNSSQVNTKDVPAGTSANGGTGELADTESNTSDDKTNTANAKASA